jgi:hypothetical protein
VPEVLVLAGTATAAAAVPKVAGRGGHGRLPRPAGRRPGGGVGVPRAGVVLADPRFAAAVDIDATG